VTGILEISPNVATLICGQLKLLKLSVTFCEYWICVQVTVLVTGEDILSDSSFETKKVGPSTPAALTAVGKVCSLAVLGLMVMVLLSVSIQYVTVIFAACAFPTPSFPTFGFDSFVFGSFKKRSSDPCRKPMFATPPPTIPVFTVTTLPGGLGFIFDEVVRSNLTKESMLWSAIALLNTWLGSSKIFFVIVSTESSASDTGCTSWWRGFAYC
jgi:hypothetical protein